MAPPRPANTLLSCGIHEPPFPAEAVLGPGLAELGLDPESAVLRSLLEHPDGAGFPATGWHRVLDGPDETIFVARGTGDMPWVTVVVGMAQGMLQPMQWGKCDLRVAAPDGVTFARWWLDPDAPRPTRDAREVSILLREQACASGREPDGRVLPPTITLTEDAVLVAIAIRKQPNADCPGNPAHAMRLVLPEPLGHRGLFDAADFPPREVTTTDPEGG